MNTLTTILFICIISAKDIMAYNSAYTTHLKLAAIIGASLCIPQFASGWVGFFGRAMEEKYKFDGLEDRTIVQKTMHKFYNGGVMASLFVGSFYIAQTYVPDHVACASALMSVYWYTTGRLGYMSGESEKVSHLFMRCRDIPAYASMILFLGTFPQYQPYLSQISKISMIGSAFTLSALPE